MHFTVLSAVSLPQDIAAAVNAVPVDDVASFRTVRKQEM